MNSLLRPVFSPTHRGVYARQPVEVTVNLLPQQTPMLALFGDVDWLAPTPHAVEVRPLHAHAALILTCLSAVERLLLVLLLLLLQSHTYTVRV